MFLSQRPNNDPMPHEIPNTYDALTGEGNVRLSEKTDGAILAPRPEFTQTRDPFPWLLPDGSRHNKSSANYLVPEVDCYAMGAVREIPGVRWAPRHEEFDTPVNPYLTIFREQMCEKLQEGSYTMQSLAAVWLEDGMEETDIEFLGFSSDQYIHARRVLSKLVAVYGG